METVTPSGLKSAPLGDLETWGHLVLEEALSLGTALCRLFLTPEDPSTKPAGRQPPPGPLPRLPRAGLSPGSGEGRAFPRRLSLTGANDAARSGPTPRATRPGPPAARACSCPQSQKRDPRRNATSGWSRSADSDVHPGCPQLFPLQRELGQGSSLHKASTGRARCGCLCSFHCLPSRPAQRPGEHRLGRSSQLPVTAPAPSAWSEASAERGGGGGDCLGARAPGLQAQNAPLSQVGERAARRDDGAGPCALGWSPIGCSLSALCSDWPQVERTGRARCPLLGGAGPVAAAQPMGAARGAGLRVLGLRARASW